MDTLEQIIRENTGWMMAWMQQKTGDRQIAEDLVQEVWLRVFRSWESYREDGRLKAWLARIARNVFHSHIARTVPGMILSLDAEEESDPLLHTLTDGLTPEETVLNRALIEEMLSALDHLPPLQKVVLKHRFLDDMTIPQVADKLDIPAGTVKSSTHYGLAALRKLMGGTNLTPKGEKSMNCSEIMADLFVYAKGFLPEEKRTEIRTHLKHCPDCADIAHALEKLIPQMPPADERMFSHFAIHFPLKHYCYVCLGRVMPDAAEWNSKLAEWGGKVPEEVSLLEHGYNTDSIPQKYYDNEGNEIIFRNILHCETYNRENAALLRKVYPYTWVYNASVVESSHWWMFSRASETEGAEHIPGDFWAGIMSNGFGGCVKSGLYQLIPRAARDIRIRMGNGILDCGPYLAIYADRYLDDEEDIHLGYTCYL